MVRWMYHLPSYYGYYPGRRVIQLNGNAELLNFIYQNAEMGVETLNKLKAITEDKEFEKVLDAQFAEYK